MADHLFFGADTTELRVQNELNQRNFIMAIPPHFSPTIQDDYDAIQGFRTIVHTHSPAPYFSWLLSTRWYNCSLTLQQMTKDNPEIVRKYIEWSLTTYPDAWKEERIREIIAKSS